MNFWRPKAELWPQIALVATIHAGVDSASCQAERNFSALSTTLDGLRAHMDPDKVEKMMLIRLNAGLIPEVRAYRAATAMIEADARA